LPEPIGISEAISIFTALPSDGGAFIVGGQALNLWAELYAGTAPELHRFAPFTSKDIDFFGHRAVAAALAERLHGRIRYPEFGRETASTAVVEVEIGGRTIVIDFINTVLGVRERDLKRGVVIVDVPAGSKSGEVHLSIAVMHPVHCLQSRISNVLHPATRRSDATAMRQLEAAPIIVREYISETVGEGETREAGRCLRWLYRYIRHDIFGKKAHVDTTVDALDILRHFRDDPRLDPRFRTHNLHRMVADIEQRRERRCGGRTAGQ
jgi:hypothetical protein